jgi:hypothetical protein
MRHPTRLRTALGLAGVILAANCSAPLDEVWQLSGYRVLGVKNEPAEVNPGDPFSLTLGSADNTVRDVTTVWFLCDHRISALAATGGTSLFSICPGASHLDMGPVAPFTAPPAGGGSLDTMGREEFTVIGSSCAGGSIGLPNSTSGGLPRCIGTNASGTMFIRSIFERTPTALNPPNQNPAISDVRFGEPNSMSSLSPTAPIAVPRCADQTNHTGCTHWQFAVLFGDGSREAYHEPDPLSGAIVGHQERLTVEYLISGGSLAGGFRSDSQDTPASPMTNDWWAPDHPGPVDVWFYGNDGRGGFDFTVRHLTVQ